MAFNISVIQAFLCCSRAESLLYSMEEIVSRETIKQELEKGTTFIVMQDNYNPTNKAVLPPKAFF